MKILFYDLETTGVDFRKNSIHHFHGKMEVDGKIVSTLDLKIRPHEKAVIEPSALRVCKVTLEEIMAYEHQAVQFKTFKNWINSHHNRYDAKDKIYLSGFNNRKFDDLFLEIWYGLNSDDFMYASFYETSLDSMILAAQYLLNRRPSMQSFKLHRVAKELGIEVDDTKTHTADYDVSLTRSIYRIVTGIDYEL